MRLTLWKCPECRFVGYTLEGQAEMGLPCPNAAHGLMVSAERLEVEVVGETRYVELQQRPVEEQLRELWGKAMLVDVLTGNVETLIARMNGVVKVLEGLEVGEATRQVGIMALEDRLTAMAERLAWLTREVLTLKAQRLEMGAPRKGEGEPGRMTAVEQLQRLCGGLVVSLEISLDREGALVRHLEVTSESAEGG